MSGDRFEDAATVAARPEPVVQPWNNPIYHPYHDAVGQLKSTPSTRLITENRRPPKIGEIIVATMAPFDTKAYLIDLGRRYRDNLQKGEKAARKLAYREARNWIIWAGLIPLLQAVFRVGSLSRLVFSRPSRSCFARRQLTLAAFSKEPAGIAWPGAGLGAALTRRQVRRVSPAEAW